MNTSTAAPSMKYAAVGNGTFGGLLDNKARYVWCCMNHFGGDPIFNCLLNNDSEETGFFDVIVDNYISSSQQYVPLTSVLVTHLKSSNGVVEIVDFAPKFNHFDRMFRPFQLFRIVRKVQGDPTVRIRIRPTFAYNSVDGYRTRGSHHIRYCGPTVTWRVTTTLSVQHVIDESPFLLLSEPEQSEETGGLLSSISMGQPIGTDTVGLGPARDARVCRLLDECLSIPVLREIGLFDVSRKFLEFLKNVVYRSDEPQHTYGALGEIEIKREKTPYLAGFQGMGEVMSGGVVKHDETNHDQHCFMYGLAVIGLAQTFFDARLDYLCSSKLFERLEFFALKAKESFAEREEATHSLGFFDDEIAFYCGGTHNEPRSNKSRGTSNTDKKDSGGVFSNAAGRKYSDDDIKLGPHTFTTILHWAAADRVSRVASIFTGDEQKARKAQAWAKVADEMRTEIEKNAWNAERKTFCTFWGGNTVGPALLRLVEIGFLKEDDPRFASTLQAFEEDAFRVSVSPNTFTTNTLFWYAEALRVCGRTSQCQTLVVALVNAYNDAGNLGESIDLKESKFWGNIPCMAAILSFMRVALRLSKKNRMNI